MAYDKALIEKVLRERLAPLELFKLDEICFKEQLAFITDPRPWVTACCSRRSGKTEVCAIDLLSTAIKNHGVVCLYLTMTRLNAERIVWKKLLTLNENFNLGGEANNTKLSLTFPNGSVIFLSGCKDKSELDKFRGLALKLVYIDEVQSFKSFIKDLVDEVLGPALADYAGKLKLIGTPGAVQSGFFFDTIQSSEYSHHKWTFWDNPYIVKLSGQTHNEILTRELKRRGVGIDNPSVRREWFGEWTTDFDSLVFRYNPAINHYSHNTHPFLTEFVIGVDIGFEDADAIAVIGWHPHHKLCYLVHEDVTQKQGITELAEKISKLITQYNPLKVVMDTGGLGKKIAEELRKRTSLPIQAAEKSRKFEYIELLNDAMRTQSFYAKNNSRFAQDAMLIEWDYDKTTPDRKVIKEEPHSDICFVAGTKIKTKRGLVNIEKICPDDLILTRDGFKEISACGKTGVSNLIELKFSNGSNLICTPNHPIYTINRGFMAADALLYSDNFVEDKICNLLMAKHIIWQRIKNIIPAVKKIKRFICMLKSGSIIMGKNQKDTTSIIKILIERIMTFQILSAYQFKNIIKSMRLISIKLETWLKYGINLKKAMNGINSTQYLGEKKIESSQNLLAQSVKRNTGEINYQKPQYFIVQTNAGRRLDVILDWTTLLQYVLSAIKNLSIINIPKENIAVTLVGQKYLIEKDSVYNLTVKDKHEYFANGILVSNCDAILYAYREALHWLSEKPKDPVNMKNHGEWLKHTEKLMEESLESQIRKQQAEENIADSIELMNMDFEDNPLKHYLNKRKR